MSKSVRFPRDPRDSPTGGSYHDHQRSDSGVGSFSSDNESRATYNADRHYSSTDYESSSLYALRDALTSETREKQQWMDKANSLDNMLIRAHKELKETQARLRALEGRVEALDDEKSQLSKTNQTLLDENTRLKEDLKDAKRSSRRKSSNSPPIMSGAIPAEEDKKPRRTPSKHHNINRESDRIERELELERIAREMDKERGKKEEREKEREKEKEMERLRKRFDSRGEESDAKSSNTSTKSKNSRRGSYVEPLGQAAPRPQVQVAQSPATRQYPPSSSYTNGNYTTQSYSAGNGSRPVHPQVVVSYSDAFPDEDGLYHAHPLPRQQRSPDRRDAPR